MLSQRQLSNVKAAGLIAILHVCLGCLTDQCSFPTVFAWSECESKESSNAAKSPQERFFDASPHSPKNTQGQPTWKNDHDDLLQLPQLIQGGCIPYEPLLPSSQCPASRGATSYIKEDLDYEDMELLRGQQRRPYVTKYPLMKSFRSLIFIFLLECYFLIALNSVLL